MFAINTQYNARLYLSKPCIQFYLAQRLAFKKKYAEHKKHKNIHTQHKIAYLYNFSLIKIKNQTKNELLIIKRFLDNYIPFAKHQFYLNAEN